MDVAETSAASLRDERALAVPGQVSESRAAFGIGNHGPHRHRPNGIRRPLAVAVGPVPTLAAAGAMDACKTVLDEGVDVAVRDRIHTAAPPAVAAVRAALGNVFLAPERSHPI